VICNLQRILVIFDLISDALKRHTNIDINLEKIQIWNTANIRPDRLNDTILMPGKEISLKISKES